MNKQYIVIGIIVGAFFLFCTSIACAQSLPLQVAPARQELELDPGDTANINIRFYNLGDSSLPGFLRVGDFIVTDNQGTPSIIDDPSLASPRFSAASWFKLPYERMAIGADSKVEIQAEIDVPDNARPGGRYVAIYFQPTTDIPHSVSAPQEAGLAITPRIAGLVYLKIKGPITEKALISRLFAPSFQEYGPIKIESEVINRGDYHIRPRGSYTLTNMFGGVVDQKKLDEVNIFPDTARSYFTEVGDKWMIGKYTLKLSAGYGETGQVVNRTTTIWLFPWKVALVILLALLIIIIFIRHLYKDLVVKESRLEDQIQKEHSEVEKLREELLKKNK